MPSQPTAEQETMRFRASTLEEAISAAEQSLGARVVVNEANRIRRGGIGGFFASDMGVEVVVSLADETMDQALERLVSESGADERTSWQERRTSKRSESASPESPEVPEAPPLAPFAEEVRRDAIRRELSRRLANPADELVVDSVDVGTAAIVGELRAIAEDETASYRRVQEAAERLSADSFLHDGDTPRYSDQPEQRPTRRLGSPSVATAATSRLGVPAAMARAVVVAPQPTTNQPVALESIIAEVLTERLPSERAVIERIKIERMLADCPAPRLVEESFADLDDLSTTTDVEESAHEPAALHLVRPTLTPPVPPAPVPTMVPTMVAQTTVEVVPVTAADVLATQRQRNSGPPSRRHVELAVAAADQLIDSLSRSGSVQRLSVRVVLRSGDQREVEAEAQWEARPAGMQEEAS